MRTLQKLGICSGVATPLPIAIYLSVGAYRFGIMNEITRSVDGFVIMLAIPCGISILFSIAAYYQATRGSAVAIAGLLILWVLILFGSSFMGFFILIWGGIFAWAVVFTPALIATITVILLISSQVKNESLHEE